MANSAEPSRELNFKAYTISESHPGGSPPFFFTTPPSPAQRKLDGGTLEDKMAALEKPLEQSVTVRAVGASSTLA